MARGCAKSVYSELYEYSTEVCQKCIVWLVQEGHEIRLLEYRIRLLEYNKEDC